MEIMSCMGDVALRDHLPALWRQIEDAHYSYLEIDDSPEKLQQKKKLEGYITEYLSLVPNECKFGLSETGKVFERTVNELGEYSAYRAGVGWAAVARYAANLLAQPWRKEYKVIRLYSGFYKHEVEANLMGAEDLLQAMGYRASGGGRLALEEPICPDMAAAISRDALIAQCECQIMCSIWEGVWGLGGRVSWKEVFAERVKVSEGVAAAVARLTAHAQDKEIYSNLPTPLEPPRRQGDTNHPSCRCPEMPLEEPLHPIIYPYMPLPAELAAPAPHGPVPMIPYGVPYYYPLQTPYMIPTPVYAPIKHAATVSVNGFVPQYRYPPVPTARLIEYDSEKDERQRLRLDKRPKSGYSDGSTPSFSRADPRPTLKAKEDGMGTYESWDYVFRNLSSKTEEGDTRSGFSQSLERDSRTSDRMERGERKKYQPTTMDLEDGLQALNLDRSADEDVYRTAKVNENLMRLKQEQEAKKAKRKQEEKRLKKTESLGNPTADGLITPQVAPDKVKLLSKKEVKDRKEVMKQSFNGQVSSAEVRKAKKPVKLVTAEVEKPNRPFENGVHRAHTSKTIASLSSQPHELKAQLVVSLDEADSRPNGRVEGADQLPGVGEESSGSGRWQCGTCTFLNGTRQVACEMCGKSRRGPTIEPLTSGGRECPACTLVNKRDATQCDACGTSLQHCPTYI